jgi:glycerol transport system substrate-binding protein
LATIVARSFIKFEQILFPLTTGAWMLPVSSAHFSTPMKINIVKKGPGLFQEPPVLAESEIRIPATNPPEIAEVFGKPRRRNLMASAVLWATVSLAGFASAGIEEAKKWVENEFQPSTLSKEEQMKEMEWFIKAAEPFKGMEINVLSETVPTHTYESEVLTKAFEQITGIKVNHQLLGEGEVVQAVQTQMQTNRNLYDAYINDSDLIGTHSRLQSAVNLTDWMAGEGKDVTLPTLDVDDFIGKSFTTGPDGKLWQLPDQQFANLYWFRKDWFDRPEIKEKFKAKYGYELGVPVNWSAYEDIANFFTNDVKEIDGVRIYGHMDYGKRAPDLGWRMTDAWLSMAGSTSKGLPNGRPIDEWGIRMEEGSCNPEGASVSRGGGTNSPASIYAIAKWDEWLRKYAPPGAADLDFYQSLPALNQGNVAQQIFWYTAFTADMVKPKSEGNNTVDDKGVPLWRMAPSPHGPYWEEGMKLGYQDCGSWTMFKSTPLDRRKAAWLYAQFTVSKTVSLKKSHVGLTIIRDSDINDKSFTERAPKLGGLVEFYRSPDRVLWTPTGINVPDYPKLAQLWWQQIGDVNSGAFTPEQAMNRLAAEMDQIMARMQAADEKAKTYGGCGPRLNPEKDPKEWLGKPDGPAAKLANEKPPGETIAYDELIKRWTKAQ